MNARSVLAQVWGQVGRRGVQAPEAAAPRPPGSGHGPWQPTEGSNVSSAGFPGGRPRGAAVGSGVGGGGLVSVSSCLVPSAFRSLLFPS